MPSFRTLEGQTLQYGQEGTYLLEDEQEFIQMLDKQVRAADPKNKEHIAAVQGNFNVISGILGLGKLPEDGELDQATIETIQYFDNNKDLFAKYGITEHITARKLKQTIQPSEVIFTETEYPPTIDEMKALEVDIGKLYENSNIA